MLKIGGDGLMNEAQVQAFRDMVVQRGHALAFSIDEIGCVSPKRLLSWSFLLCLTCLGT